MACLYDTTKPEHSWWGTSVWMICTDCNFWDCIGSGGFWWPGSCGPWLEAVPNSVEYDEGCPHSGGGYGGSCCTNDWSLSLIHI